VSESESAKWCKGSTSFWMCKVRCWRWLFSNKTPISLWGVGWYVLVGAQVGERERECEMVRAERVEREHFLLAHFEPAAVQIDV